MLLLEVIYERKKKKKVLFWQDAKYVVWFPYVISNMFIFSGLPLSDILLLNNNDSLYVMYSMTNSPLSAQKYDCS